MYTPPFYYVDDSFSVNTSTNLFEQGMNPIRADGLNQLNGQRINSYNSFYLSTKRKLSEIFTFTQLANSLNTIITPLRFGTGPSYKYLKFAVDGFFLVGSEDTETGTTRFQLVFETDRTMYIKHVTNNVEYRLCFENDGTIYFATTATSQKYSLGYLIDSDGYLILYNTDQVPYKIITYTGTTLVQSPISAGETTRGGSSLITIDYNYTYLDYNIDSSWVGYNRFNINLAEINSNRSAFDLDNQYLLTTTYNNIHNGIDINFLNLKTNISESNVVKRGSSLNTGPSEIPSVDYRFYSSINTGNSQEWGNEDIVLTYVFFDKDIKVEPGTDTYFTTPSSIYPYNQININDTKFVVNGAYGSISPLVSDKIKKLRKNSSGFNNGRYLVTWLSGNGYGDSYRWVDRYYYPDLITKEEAYTADIFRPSFDDPIDSVVYSELYKQEINRSPIFDKASDLFLEPDTKYVYQRVSQDDFTNYLNSLSSYVVYSRLEQTQLNGKTSTTIDIDKINQTGKFTVSLDAYLKPNRTIGYALLGNLTNFGFSILNDTFITPVLVTMQEKMLYCYNTDFVLLAKQQFDKNIKDIIRFDGLDNYIVVCEEGYVYNLTFNNVITRLNIVPQLSSYTSYTAFNDKVAFVLDTAGTCLIVDNNTLTTSFSAATNTGASDINGVFFYLSALKGVVGTNIKQYDDNNICYVTSNTIYKQHVRTNDVNPVIQSSTTLNDYAIDKDGNYLLVHNNERLSLYNRNRERLFIQPLSNIPLSGSKCEFIRQFVSDAEENYITVAGIDGNQKMRFALFDYNGTLSATSIVQGNLSATDTNFTNYNYFVNNDYTNTLRFKIRLANPKNNLDIYTNTITYNYGNIAEGYVNFGYIFDSVRGKIKFLVNGLPVENIDFDPAKYTVTDLFGEDLTLGGAGFYNSNTLSDYLKQPYHYNAANTSVKNTIILNKPLRERELSVVSLIGDDIDTISLSIPCGQRNNIEEIVRIFKFGVPESYSNHIKIEIKNSGITNGDLQNTLKNRITNILDKYTKGDVIIDDISFIDYTQPV